MKALMMNGYLTSKTKDPNLSFKKLFSKIKLSFWIRLLCLRILKLVSMKVDYGHL